MLRSKADFMKMSCSDFDLLSVLTPEIWAMKVLGFWKSENRHTMYSSVFYKIYRGAIWLGMAIFQIFGYMFVYQKWHTISIGDISSVMFLNISIFNVQLVTTCIFLNVDRLRIIIHQLTSEILQLKTERHVKIAKQLKRSGDFIRKYYYSLLIFILLVQPTLKILGRDKEPFYDSYIPPALGHIGVLIFQEIITAVAGYAGCNYCILDMNLMTGISIQIEILKDILCESDDIDVIFECIKRHQQIVRLVDNVQHIQRIGISVSFFTGVLLFCSTLFKILEMETDFNFSELMFVLPYSLGSIFVIFVHCWYGNDIIYRSAGITNAIFDSNWIGAKQSMQKTVVLFMAFTKDPLRLQLAGGLFDMNMPVFVSISRTAYSFFTILQKFE